VIAVTRWRRWCQTTAKAVRTAESAIKIKATDAMFLYELPTHSQAR
jgi:hypothetical protein